MARIYQDDHNVLVGQGPQAILYQYDINVLVSDVPVPAGLAIGFQGLGQLFQPDGLQTTALQGHRFQGIPFLVVQRTV